MSRTTDIINLIAEHGEVWDECDVEAMRNMIGQCPQHVLIENDKCALWAYPINWERWAESEFDPGVGVNPDTWFVWLALGDLSYILGSIPFMLSRVIFYRANKSGDRTLREYSLPRLITLHEKRSLHTPATS